MLIRSKRLTFDQICAIVRDVSERHYDGNVIVHPDAHALYGNGNGMTGRLRTVTNDGPGARRSWSGRRGPTACWHAYRDALRAVLSADPTASVLTMLARYDGLTGFESTYPGTANLNIGSEMMPAYAPELCDCNGWE
jgi:hypothetical protein